FERRHADAGNSVRGIGARLAIATRRGVAVGAAASYGRDGDDGENCAGQSETSHGCILIPFSHYRQGGHSLPRRIRRLVEPPMCHGVLYGWECPKRSQRMACVQGALTGAPWSYGAVSRPRRGRLAITSPGF